MVLRWGRCSTRPVPTSCLPRSRCVPPSRSSSDPDLLVARDEDLTEAYLPTTPVLAVEVLSPSTKFNDLNSQGPLRAVRRPELVGHRSAGAQADRVRARRRR
ncbi:Uma2 family endonuclease [Saccharopolyspora rhizosphaerae]|uniref:Uma2 family endonuclease n=1 Tax=Saccharopolyspora rhizosphaerae TaxID=2492662 RepID=UPI002D7A13B2|nr:Uma2 family endonuclease [Saccharopolyspora rhizosphaerae]